MLKWLFFDVGSTLVDEKLAYEHRIRDAIEGSAITYDRFCSVMMENYKAGRKGDLETVKQFGLTLSPWHSEDERLYPDAADCLNKLHKAYRIGIIANQTPGTADRLNAFGIADQIDLIIASAEEGIAKPDPGIFLRALQRAGCKPDEAAMIGDRLDNDIAPANKLGMTTIWIRQGFGQYQTPTTADEIPDWTVENLTDLADELLKK